MSAAASSRRRTRGCAPGSPWACRRPRSTSPSASTPVGDRMPLDPRVDERRCTRAASRAESMSTGGETRDSISTGLTNLQVLLRERMDHEREAVSSAEAVRVDDPRLRLEAGDDRGSRRRGSRRPPSRWPPGSSRRAARRERMAVHRRRGVEHHRDALVAKARHALFVDRRRDDGLAGQLLDAEGVQRGHVHRSGAALRSTRCCDTAPGAAPAVRRGGATPGRGARRARTD